MLLAKLGDEPVWWDFKGSQDAPEVAGALVEPAGEWTLIPGRELPLAMRLRNPVDKTTAVKLTWHIHPKLEVLSGRKSETLTLKAGESREVMLKVAAKDGGLPDFGAGLWCTRRRT